MEDESWIKHGQSYAKARHITTFTLCNLTERKTKQLLLLTLIFIEITIIIWKFKAGKAELWLSTLCDCALTQADLKFKKWHLKCGPHYTSVSSTFVSSMAGVNLFGRSWSLTSLDNQNKHGLTLKCSIKKALIRQQEKAYGWLTPHRSQWSEPSSSPGHNKNCRKKYVTELKHSTKWIMVFVLNVCICSVWRFNQAPQVSAMSRYFPYYME